MHIRSVLAIPVAAVVCVSSAYPVLASKESAIETVESATQVFKGVMDNPKTMIPDSVLQSSVAIAIIPNVVKAGFIVAGSRGKGVLVQRQDGNTWSNPAFLTITSGSIGFQAGGQSSDIILVFRNANSVDSVLTGDVQIGGNVSVAAGPVGKEVVSVTDGQPETDIYAYVLSEGLFAGVSVEGAQVSIDSKRNRQYYGQRSITVQQIFATPTLAVGDEVVALRQALSGAIAN